jgi:hypothetical protein
MITTALWFLAGTVAGVCGLIAFIVLFGIDPPPGKCRRCGYREPTPANGSTRSPA